MSISNESLPIIAGIITNTARSMTTVMRYIYTVSDSDFYNINIKDVFRIALMDVTETSRLENLGIRIKTPENDAMFETAEFGRVQHLIMYSLAARLPLISRQIEDFPLSDKQLKQVFELLIKSGADNFGDIIYESYEENLKVRKQKTPLPSYSSDWFRRYVYTYMPKFGEINNRNLYFLGCVEAMFPLYYSAMTAQLKKVMFLLDK